MKADRRKAQSERDKAKHAEATKAADHAEERPAPKRRAPEQPARAEAASKRPRTDVADDIEAGNLVFEPSAAKLPFEAGVNRKGAKMQRLREQLRREEAIEKKLHGAAGREREELNRDIEMRKALQRAKGEKVHDDVSKLRKTQKALEVVKKKGKEKWEAREKTVKDQ